MRDHHLGECPLDGVIQNIREIDPHTGGISGTTPRRFSRLALINACVRLICEDERISAG